MKLFDNFFQLIIPNEFYNYTVDRWVHPIFVSLPDSQAFLFYGKMDVVCVENVNTFRKNDVWCESKNGIDAFFSKLVSELFPSDQILNLGF